MDCQAMEAAAKGGAEEQEFPIFVRKRPNEAYSVMNFRCTEDVVFAEWREARMRRQDNSHSQERGPARAATGAGTEGGRRPGVAPRDQATYRPEEQPWLLRVDGRRRRTFRGRREGGVADHSAYYVFAMQADGTIEATPVGQWHTFEPLHTYKTLSIEEAEQLYKNRDKKLDYFAVMIQKRLNDAKLEAGEEENDAAGEGAGAGAGSGSCEAGEAEDCDGRCGESSGDEDDGAKKKSQREQSRAKMNRLYSGESDDEQIAEMDDDDDSSDSLEADDDEADTQDQKDGEENAEENKETEEANGKDATGEEDKEPEEGEITENKRPEGGIEGDVAVATELEATVTSAGAGRSDDDGGGRGGAKNGSERHRRRLGAGAGAGAGAGGDWRAPRAPLPPELVALEEAARRHLLRRPVTVQQLLRRLKPHRRGLPAERVVDAMARVLRAINPRRRLVHGKMYLFVD